MSEHDVAGGSAHKKELHARGSRDGLECSHYPADSRLLLDALARCDVALGDNPVKRRTDRALTQLLLGQRVLGAPDALLLARERQALLSDFGLSEQLLDHLRRDELLTCQVLSAR